MIVNICAFMLGCFAIMSIIKPIKSAGNQIVPIRFFHEASYEPYLRTVNNLKTFNNNPIVIKPIDRDILSEPGFETIREYKLKLKSRDKFEKKAKDIKCSFCVIAKYNILKLTNIVEELKRGEQFIHNEETLIRLEEEAKMIIYLLLFGNFKSGNWLWSYFFKIVAIRQYEDNTPFIHENPFEDEQLQTGVLDFIENCITERYLPPTAMEYDWVSKNKSIYRTMFSDLYDSGLFFGIFLDRNTALIEFIYLKPFWYDENQLLFRQIAEVNVDWSVPKQRHEAEVAVTREFLANRTWIYKPYDRLHHQHLLIKIIDARFYCYLSVILHIYEKQLSRLDEQTLKHIKDLICNVIYGVLTITAFKDEFLVVILSEFEFAKIYDIDDINDILARVRTKADEILSDLNGASTTVIDRLSLNVNENQLSTNDLIIRIIVYFKDYLNQLKAFCMPFTYKVPLTFMDVVQIPAAQFI